MHSITQWRNRKASDNKHTLVFEESCEPCVHPIRASDIGHNSIWNIWHYPDGSGIFLSVQNSRWFWRTLAKDFKLIVSERTLKSAIQVLHHFFNICLCFQNVSIRLICKWGDVIDRGTFCHKNNFVSDFSVSNSQD